MLSQKEVMCLYNQEQGQLGYLGSSLEIYAHERRGYNGKTKLKLTKRYQDR